MMLCRLGLSSAPLGLPSADGAACQEPEEDVELARLTREGAQSWTEAWDPGTTVPSTQLGDPQGHRGIRWLCTPCARWASSKARWRGDGFGAGSGRGSQGPCVPWCSVQPGQDPWASQDLSHLLLLTNQELFCRKCNSNLWVFKPNSDCFHHIVSKNFLYPQWVWREF